MKKIVIITLSLALCLTLAACGSNQTVTSTDNSAPPSPSASATPETPDTPASATPNAEAPADQPDEMVVAYAAALQNLLQNRKFPDGTEAAEPFGDMSENTFALYDVDNDGEEELLLMYSNTYSAGMAAYVFKYDDGTKTLETELMEFPYLTFYDNGIIKAGWSHNQGRAGDTVWPYSLYQYAPETDSYVLVGMVDAWDKKVTETDDQNNPFPSDVDTSGTGLVYYIMEDGQYDTTHPVDVSDYTAWVDGYLKDASEVQIQFINLTEENITQLVT